MPKNNLTTRNAAFGLRQSPASLDDTARTVDFVLATEGRVPIWDWERGMIDEILLMSGCSFPEQVPLLDAHSRCSIEDQLGSLRGLRVEGESLLATAHFSSTAGDAFRKVAEGHLTDISVGYSVDESYWIPEGETDFVGESGRSFAGPVRVVSKWTVREGSLTPIGADDAAKARSQQCNPEATMPNTLPSQTTPEPVATPPVQKNRSASEPLPVTAPDAVQEPVVPDDAARAADILSLAVRHGMPELAERAIREHVNLDAFRAQVLDAISSRNSESVPGFRVSMGQDEGEKFRAAAADSLVLRTSFGRVVKAPAPGAEELRGFTLAELARDCLRRAGKPTRGDMDMVGRAFTTSDFPSILADAAHRAVLAGAEEAQETYSLWTGEATAADFREHTGATLESFSTLDRVNEDGEYTHGAISDRGAVFSVATYGKLFSISRQAVINNDLNQFTEIPRKMGQAAERTVADLVHGLLTSTANLKDGKPLFHADRKNLLTAAAISAASFGKAVTAMGTQKDSAGKTLALRPSFLIIPVALQMEAYQLLNATVIGTQAEPNRPNPWTNYCTPVIEPRLDGTGALPWFLAGMRGTFLSVAWLGGNKTPRVEQRQGWTIDGTEFKVSIDAGAFINDPRAGTKNPGVAPA